jgi:hypothetical protein
MHLPIALELKKENSFQRKTRTKITASNSIKQICHNLRRRKSIWPTNIKHVINHQTNRFLARLDYLSISPKTILKGEFSELTS